MKFAPKTRTRQMLAALICVSVVTSLLGDMVGDIVRTPVRAVLAPMGDMAMTAATMFRSRLSLVDEESLTLADARKLRDKLASVQGDVERLRTQMRYWRRQCGRIQRIRETFGPKAETCEIIPARIVLNEALPYGSARTANVGTEKGADEGFGVIEVLTDRSKALPKGLAAVTVRALVGRIEDSGRFVCRIQLVTDRGFQHPANIHRVIKKDNPRSIIITKRGNSSEQKLTRRNNRPIPVVVYGNGRNELYVADVPRIHNVQPGDWILTTGDTKDIPVVLPIARITRVEPSDKNANFVRLYAKPRAHLDTLRDVYIVRPGASKLLPRKKPGKTRGARR